MTKAEFPGNRAVQPQANSPQDDRAETTRLAVRIAVAHSDHAAREVLSRALASRLSADVLAFSNCEDLRPRWSMMSLWCTTTLEKR